jgi:hypothetical protein
MLDQASLLEKSRDVNAAYRRTTQLVARELERIALAEQVLEGDSKTLKGSLQEHDAYRGAAGASEASIKAFEAQERGDRLVLAASFACFLAVIAWIVWKRTGAWFVA